VVIPLPLILCGILSASELAQKFVNLGARDDFVVKLFSIHILVATGVAGVVEELLCLLVPLAPRAIFDHNFANVHHRVCRSVVSLALVHLADLLS